MLEVWREACRQAEVSRALEGVVRVVGPRLGADFLLVRLLDLDRALVETIAACGCHAGAVMPSKLRSVCKPGMAAELFAWAREGKVLAGTAPASGGLLSVVVPPGLQGPCIAGPLVGDHGSIGMLVAVGQRAGRFGAPDAELFTALMEPVGIAFANHLRIRELGRLREALEADRQALLSRLDRQDVTESIVGTSTGLREVMERVEQVAGTDAPVLVIGETGTGKEVVARAIHAHSRRAAGPVVRVNCGAIPPGLIDSELFGHERGSFTGAVATRQGWFERANGGTLFLDEVGELPLDAQVRLLRILQDGTFERVGGQRLLTVDVRIVAATHRDLREMVANGTFREDLWYRISVFPITLPPLRERVEDIPMLSAHFARRAGHRLRGRTLVPSPSDVELLIKYPWPGNVRELAAVIERAAILGDGSELRVAAALGLEEPKRPATRPESGSAAPELPSEHEDVRPEPLTSAMTRHAELALQWSGGRVGGARGAARVLGLNPHTLRAKLRKLGVNPARFRGATSPAPAGPPPATWNAAVVSCIEAALRASAGRIEGTAGAAQRLGVNAQTLRARMKRLDVRWARFRSEAGPLTAKFLR